MAVGIPVNQMGNLAPGESVKADLAAPVMTTRDHLYPSSIALSAVARETLKALRSFFISGSLLAAAAHELEWTSSVPPFL